MTATALLTRRFLAEYSRQPINLVLLAVVPLIFVLLAAGAIGDFAAIVGIPPERLLDDHPRPLRAA